MEWLDSPIVIGLAIGIPSFALGILGFRQAQKNIKKAEKAQSIEQIITGLNSLADNLQRDNASLREQLGKLMALPSEVEKLKREIAALKHEIANLKKKLGTKV